MTVTLYVERIFSSLYRESPTYHTEVEGKYYFHTHLTALYQIQHLIFSYHYIYFYRFFFANGTMGAVFTHIQSCRVVHYSMITDFLLAHLIVLEKTKISFL